jgi:FkbM family methyltransferase
MKIYYGYDNNLHDVSSIAFKNMINNKIYIPATDHERANIFTDVAPGILKHIVIEDNYGNRKKIESMINIVVPVDINLLEYEILSKDPIRIVNSIHQNIQLRHGNFNEELPEQHMSAMFIEPENKVLEIGGNIGRNSLVIASLLNNSSNLVSLESDPDIAQQLIENRDINNLHFHVEPFALSKRPLIQKGWDTIISDDILPGYKRINTIDFIDIQNKYKIKFDTLVVDCEGALYYILQDYPEILENIQIIIMENDYHNIQHKNYINLILDQNGFINIYRKNGGWGPCYDCFFETWKKI